MPVALKRFGSGILVGVHCLGAGSNSLMIVVQLLALE